MNNTSNIDNTITNNTTKRSNNKTIYIVSAERSDSFTCYDMRVVNKHVTNFIMSGKLAVLVTKNGVNFMSFTHNNEGGYTKFIYVTEKKSTNTTPRTRTTTSTNTNKPYSILCDGVEYPRKSISFQSISNIARSLLTKNAYKTVQILHNNNPNRTWKMTNMIKYTLTKHK